MRKPRHSGTPWRWPSSQLTQLPSATESSSRPPSRSGPERSRPCAPGSPGAPSSPSSVGGRSTSPIRPSRARPGLQPAGPAEHERHMDRLLVRHLLGPEAMRPEHVAVVRGDDDERVVPDRLEQPAELGIDRRDAREVVAQRLVPVRREVAVRHLVGIVRRAVGHGEEERPLVRLGQELQRQLGLRLGLVAARLHADGLLVARPVVRVDVVVRAVRGRPVAEAAPPLGGDPLVPRQAVEMPLADPARPVPGAREHVRERRDPRSQGEVVGHDVVLMRQQPRQQRGAAGPADRRVGERAADRDAALRERVEVRRAHGGAAEPALLGAPPLVREDKEEVHPVNSLASTSPPSTPLSYAAW